MGTAPREYAISIFHCATPRGLIRDTTVWGNGSRVKIKALLQGVAKVYSTFLPWQGDPVGDEGRRIHHSSNRPHKVDAGRPTVPRILTSRKVQIQGSTLLRHHFQHSCKDGTTGGNKGEVINIQEATHPLPRDMTTQSAFPQHRYQGEVQRKGPR